MKTLLVSLILITSALTATSGQSPVKASIQLKDGKTIDVYHFGKLTCESNRYASTYTILRGKYNGNHTEINDYKDISKLEFTGFTALPAASVGNQKGKITVIKKSGISVPLDDAELVMSCYDPADRYNVIRVQILNPLTEKKGEMAVEMRNIVSISF